MEMSDNALDVLAARLALVEERLAKLEAAHVPGAQPDFRNRATPPQPAEPVSSIDAALIGKSVLIIGGGYVLRALTEMGVLAQSAGIALGLVYALFWMVVADRALKRGKVVVALFDAATAALIAASLIWEATTRFHLLTPALASALIVVASFAMLAVAWRQRSPAVGLIAAVLASLTCIGVAIGTSQPAAPTLAASFIGLAISWLSVRQHWPVYLTSIIAAASDSLALPLIVMTVMAQGTDNLAAEITLIVFAMSWLAVPAVMRERQWPQLGQAVIATVVGLGGAAIVAQFHNGDVIEVAVASLVISAAACAAAILRSRDDVLAICAAVAAFVGTILVLEPVARAVVWAAAAVASSFAARRWSWDSMNVHAACWALAAAIAAGLPSALVTVTDPSLVVVIIGVAAAVALWCAPGQAHRSRLILLAIVTVASIAVTVGVVSGLMTNRAILAMTRTVALSIAAVVLAAISSNVEEARTLARILLVAGGAKLLLEDLTAGRAVTIAVALAVYGGAIVIVARTRVSFAPRSGEKVPRSGG
jgi:hypothetical protein